MARWPARPAAPAAAPRKVLIVEDNEDARRVLELLPPRDGHEVSNVHDGPSALAEARKFVPDVVLLDIGLPGMDGYAVARELRQSSDAYLIALTGNGQPEDRERSRAAGFDEHLLKPVMPEHLREALLHAPSTPSR